MYVESELVKHIKQGSRRKTKGKHAKISYETLTFDGEE